MASLPTSTSPSPSHCERSRYPSFSPPHPPSPPPPPCFCLPSIPPPPPPRFCLPSISPPPLSPSPPQRRQHHYHSRHRSPSHSRSCSPLRCSTCSFVRYPSHSCSCSPLRSPYSHSHSPLKCSTCSFISSRSPLRSPYSHSHSPLKSSTRSFVRYPSHSRSPLRSPFHSHSPPQKPHHHYPRRPRSPSTSTSTSPSPSPFQWRQHHYHSRHRSRFHSNFSTERSQVRIPLRHRSRKIQLRRSRSRDRHSRHGHEYPSRPSRYMRNYPLERRNESPMVRSSPLLLYRHFINDLNVNMSPEEAHRRYKPYLRQLKKGFFAAHKDDQSLKEMYHPSHIQSAIGKRNEYANAKAENFFYYLQNGTFMLLTLNPPGNALRQLKDLNQARCLIAKVDAEKDIQQNLLLSSQQDGSFSQFVTVKNSDQSIITLTGILLWNVVIRYLWDVHAIDYYGMTEIGEDLINGEEKNLAAAEVEQRLDSVWQRRLQARDPLNLSLGKYKLECLVNRNLCAHFTIVEKEKEDGHIKIKYVCKENSCGKRCKAFGDIITHIHDEHSGVVEGYSAQAREEIYLENYMNDSFAPCTVN